MLYEMRVEESMFWNEGEPHVTYTTHMLYTQHTCYINNNKAILEEWIILKHYLTPS